MRASFVFSEVSTGLRRNVTMTVAMILTTAISLVMFGIGLMVVKAVDLTKDNYLDELEVAVFLTDEISKKDVSCTQQPCASLKQDLELNPAVDTVVYRDQDEAYEVFKKAFKNEPTMLELASPEAIPASLQVRLKSPEQSAAIVKGFAERQGVSLIHDGGETVDRLVDSLRVLRNVTFVGSLVLLLAALLLIANMIQISAYTRRTEVGIMRLVGATRWYTQLPFLLEAMVAGAIGAVLAITGLLSMQVLLPSGFANQLENVVRFPGTFYTAFVISPILLLTAMLISSLVGYVTLRLYVRH
ncbi:permease-like cell division protein FtsX [Haloechinothrix halophila]|uniref:permease-like cell division protein FtsX n=1 Tax=Haloechinothrix halophila TaxID=1069073 RepID=UPI000422939E|nr:permease-like cell division protein FtsX [Haloechinothrix halophila]